jgi:hypothetical protein
MIQGFFLQSSAFPGEDVSLHIATDAPQFRVDIYRQGEAFEKRLSTDWKEGKGFRGQDHVPWDDWSVDGTAIDETGDPQGTASGWNGLTINIPSDWISGVYIAILVEGDGNGPRAPLPEFTNGDSRNGKALLVVRNPSPGVNSQLLYKLPLFTYQSYNSVNKWHYSTKLNGYEKSSIYQGTDVSLRRPGGGTGGTPWDIWNFDPWDNLNNQPVGTPRQTFQHWDAKLIAWLEGCGYRIDYCTDWDLHSDDAPSILSAYSVVLSVGHDEYYSAPMRAHLEDFIAAGGNIAFLSGNTCWWRTEIDSQRPFVMHGQQTIKNWCDPVVGLPEDSLTGVSFRNGGDGNGDRTSIGYVVQHVDQWPFEGTGVSEGDVIGGEDGLVGYECDGAPYDKDSPRPFEAIIDPSVGTPSNLMILGTADVSNIVGSLGGLVCGNGGATMTMFSRNGTIFTGATTDWPRVAALGDKRVGIITRNVLDRFGGNPKGIADLARFESIVACDGFFSDDFELRHAVVATRNGEITEVFFGPHQGQGQTVLITEPGLIDLAAFYSSDDHSRHVVTLSKNGDLVEVFYSPEKRIERIPLANIPRANRVAAFFTPDDSFRHAIVATDSGEVLDVFFNPKSDQGQVSLGRFPGLVDIGAFVSRDDSYRCVLVGTDDGNITEVSFQPGRGVDQVLIGNVAGVAKVSAYYAAGVAKVSAYYAAGDHFFKRRVQVMTKAGRIHEIRYHPKFGVMRAVLINLSDLIDLGGFYSSDDEFRHSVIATKSGLMQDLSFQP